MDPEPIKAHVGLLARGQKILEGCFGLLIAVWGIGAVIMIPVYNWRYASEHGFMKWFMLEEGKPTMDGIFWPMFALSKFALSERPKELAYWTSLRKANIKYPSLEVDSDLVEEARRDHGENAAMDVMATVSLDAKRKFDADGDALDRIEPPKRYDKIHTSMLIFFAMESSLYEEIARAASSHDSAGVKDAWTKMREYTVRRLPLLKQMHKEYSEYYLPSEDGK